MSNSENAFDAENIDRTNTYQNLAQELSKELSAEGWEK